MIGSLLLKLWCNLRLLTYHWLLSCRVRRNWSLLELLCLLYLLLSLLGFKLLEKRIEVLDFIVRQVFQILILQFTHNFRLLEVGIDQDGELEEVNGEQSLFIDTVSDWVLLVLHEENETEWCPEEEI